MAYNGPDKIAQELDKLKLAMKGMLTLTDGMPAIANYAMSDISDQIIRTAQSYLKGDQEPYNEDWPALWEEERALYKWTPEWNKEQRRMLRTDDHPLYDTGDLANSLKVLEKSKMRSGLKVSVKLGSTSEYFPAHEFGMKNPLPKGNAMHEDIPARPFLIPAIRETYHNRRYKDSLKRVIDKMVEDALMKNKRPNARRRTRK